MCTEEAAKACPGSEWIFQAERCRFFRFAVPKIDLTLFNQQLSHPPLFLIPGSPNEQHISPWYVSGLSSILVAVLLGSEQLRRLVSVLCCAIIR